MLIRFLLQTLLWPYSSSFQGGGEAAWVADDEGVSRSAGDGVERSSSRMTLSAGGISSTDKVAASAGAGTAVSESVGSASAEGTSVAGSITG